MIAVYYLSQSIGHRRKDGEPFYVMNALTIDRYGLLNAVPVFFPDLATYNKVLEMQIPGGTPIYPKVSLSGHCLDVTVDNRYAPLGLDAPNPAKK